ncbi:MAG: MazG nucleotide pyrophosphohydrolase domain-containing protein [Cetobacterium sp.]
MNNYNFKKVEIEKLLLSKEPMINKIIFMEELAELQKEISKSSRGFKNKSKVKEEMADVLIVIQMMKIMYGIDDETLEREVKRKMKRNILRMEIEKI